MMEKLIIGAAIVAVLYFILRVRSVYKRVRHEDRGDQIRRELEALRKKRDEDA